MSQVRLPYPYIDGLPHTTQQQLWRNFQAVTGAPPLNDLILLGRSSAQAGFTNNAFTTVEWEEQVANQASGSTASFEFDSGTPGVVVAKKRGLIYVATTVQISQTNNNTTGQRQLAAFEDTSKRLALSVPGIGANAQPCMVSATMATIIEPDTDLSIQLYQDSGNTLSLDSASFNLHNVLFMYLKLL